MSGFSNSTRGVFVGGSAGIGGEKRLEYITIASLGNATNFGEILFGRNGGQAACASATRGIYGGGSNAPSPIPHSSIEFIIIANDGTNASLFGELLQPKQQLAACSNAHGGI